MRWVPKSLHQHLIVWQSQLPIQGNEYNRVPLSALAQHLTGINLHISLVRKGNHSLGIEVADGDFKAVFALGLSRTIFTQANGLNGKNALGIDLQFTFACRAVLVDDHFVVQQNSSAVGKVVALPE